MEKTLETLWQHLHEKVQGTIATINDNLKEIKEHSKFWNIWNFNTGLLVTMSSFELLSGDMHMLCVCCCLQRLQSKITITHLLACLQSTWENLNVTEVRNNRHINTKITQRIRKKISVFKLHMSKNTCFQKGKRKMDNIIQDAHNDTT